MTEFATGFEAASTSSSRPNGDLAYMSFGAEAGTRHRCSGSSTATARRPPSPPPPRRRRPRRSTSTFSAAGSSDPDGEAVTYEWDLTATARRTATGPTVSHTYARRRRTRPRSPSATRAGAESRDTVAIAVDETPPVASLDAPPTARCSATGRRWSCAARPDDVETATLSGGALPGASSSTTAATPTSSRISAGRGAALHAGRRPRRRLLLRDRFTATDSEGQQDTKTVMIRPETVALTLASSPPGATLSYSARAYLAPATVTSAIGYHTSVSAPETLTADGASYVFDGWSDGGERSHEFVVPAANTTLTPAIAPLPGRPQACPARPAGCSARRPGTHREGPAAAPAPRPSGPPHPHAGRRRARRGGEAARAGRAADVSSGGRCRRWSADRGRLAGLSRACASGHTWIRAAVTKTGVSAWRFKARLRGIPRAGRYVVATRVTDRRGRTVIGAKSAPMRLR